MLSTGAPLERHTDRLAFVIQFMQYCYRLPSAQKESECNSLKPIGNKLSVSAPRHDNPQPHSDLNSCARIAIQYKAHATQTTSTSALGLRDITRLTPHHVRHHCRTQCVLCQMLLRRRGGYCRYVSWCSFCQLGRRLLLQ